MSKAIFISYRRDDSEGEAGRLFDDLVRAFGPRNVFLDVHGIRFGVDFRDAIEENVSACGVLLAIVGPTWLSVAGADGTRRLDDPNDFVALEIASALRRNVPVIPVMVRQAKLPLAANLPEGVKELAFRNSIELTHPRWSSDVSLLIEALKSYVTPAQPDAVAAPPRVQSTSASMETALAVEPVIKHLATFIGPLAKIIVTRLARQCRDLDQLYLEAAKQIDSKAEQEKFLRTRPR